MHRFFLDTEWADDHGAELISLGLVSEDGAHCFYVERDPLPAHPTDFAKETVYPLLERGTAALKDVDITNSLRAFLSQWPQVGVVVDYINDIHLLDYALAGFSLPACELTTCGPLPQVGADMVHGKELQGFIDAWFHEDLTRLAKRHHALTDAHALRAGWLALQGAHER